LFVSCWMVFRRLLDPSNLVRSRRQDLLFGGGSSGGPLNIYADRTRPVVRCGTEHHHPRRGGQARSATLRRADIRQAGRSVHADRHYQLGHWLRSARPPRGVRRGEPPLHQGLHHQRGQQVRHPNVGAREGQGTTFLPSLLPLFTQRRGRGILRSSAHERRVDPLKTLTLFKSPPNARGLKLSQRLLRT
jgi:hypothetical protein